MPGGASVVDLGCGNGELLSILRDRGHSPLLGVERDQDEVVECAARGHNVIHADIDQGLMAIPDQSFEVALLSQTLQSIVDVAGVLEEIVRIAVRGIVSFPNFAHAPMREMFLREGRLPKEEGLYAYDWHDTPNRRFPSIVDFRGTVLEARNPRARSDLLQLEGRVQKSATIRISTPMLRSLRSRAESASSRAELRALDLVQPTTRPAHSVPDSR